MLTTRPPRPGRMGTRRMASARRFGPFLALVVGAGCTPGMYYEAPASRQSLSGYQTPAEGGLPRLASDLAGVLPGTDVLSALPEAGACAPGNVAVVHTVLPERILFETDSDQPAREAGSALDLVAQSIQCDAPVAEVTVLGHTDAVGSDAYNIGLSRRRAETVLRALLTRGLRPQQLSTVAIGKRQPIADNGTPEGRARNRRVEFLVSPCLAANLQIIKRVTTNPAPVQAEDADAAVNGPLEVLRLQPSGPDSYELRTVAAISLNKAAADVGAIAAEAPTARIAQKPTHPSRLLPSAGSAHPSRSPAYQPRTLAPDVEPKSLGPAISY